ncbi:uncharacterized protein LOC123485629 [Coregonus clupeaformis]|uniref:uncharacterized protein LOC123485629 n=1 Tax=Coregonus clupeaformis TaxID=59861 RepID=UPI001E1C57AF|nr:uncharacterized protein LOC123485629 [Coregonus clupeaformis]
MSTTATPTIPSQLTSDQLTVIVAAFSCLVFFVVIVVLLSIYRKEPHCCKDAHGDMDAPPQYYSSRQTLVGNPCLEQTQEVMHDNTQTQSGQLFLIGLPSSYRLPSWRRPPPRLPSYESVRKKDRQRQIHMMIADRFGLNGPMLTEPPPTYEESIRHSIEVPLDILGSGIDTPHPQNIYPPHRGTDLTTQSEVTTQCPSTQDANSATQPV